MQSDSLRIMEIMCGLLGVMLGRWRVLWMNRRPWRVGGRARDGPESSRSRRRRLDVVAVLRNNDIPLCHVSPWVREGEAYTRSGSGTRCGQPTAGSTTNNTKGNAHNEENEKTGRHAMFDRSAGRVASGDVGGRDA